MPTDTYARVEDRDFHDFLRAAGGSLHFDGAGKVVVRSKGFDDTQLGQDASSARGGLVPLLPLLEVRPAKRDDYPSTPRHNLNLGHQAVSSSSF